MPRARVPLLALACTLASACSPPRVAKLGTGSGEDTSGATTDPGWNDETTSTPGPDGGADAEGGADEGPRYDLFGGGQIDMGGQYTACPDPLPSTAVSGQTSLGPFAGVHAYFGDGSGEIDLIVFDESADLQHEIAFADWYGAEIDQGPAIRGFVTVYWDELPVDDVFVFEHITPNESLWFMARVTIEAAEYEGDNPFVPAVVHGTMAPWPEDAADAVSGAFSATRCSVFEQDGPPAE